MAAADWLRRGCAAIADWLRRGGRGLRPRPSGPRPRGGRGLGRGEAKQDGTAGEGWGSACEGWRTVTGGQNSGANYPSVELPRRCGPGTGVGGTQQKQDFGITVIQMQELGELWPEKVLGPQCLRSSA